MTSGARLMQALGILVLRAWLRACFRVRVRWSGPRPQGACVFAGNHRSFADPPLIGVWQAQPIAYFARSSLWAIPPIAFMLDLMQGIPVDRAAPTASSLSGAIDRLRRGIAVCVFPEGTRTRTGRLGTCRGGPAMLARRAGVPLVPVYLHRSEAVWPQGSPLPRLCGARIEIRFGPPLIAPPGLPPRLAEAVLTTALQRWLERQEAALCGPSRSSPRRSPRVPSRPSGLRQSRPSEHAGHA